MKEKVELVSIVVPVYNSWNFLGETIDSVLAQTFENWELILVDDNSDDSSRELIKSYENRDKRIRGIFLEENKGAGYTRNIGLDESRGDFIAFLDSDDIWLPRKLEKQIELLEMDSKLKFVYSWYSIIDEKGLESAYFVTPKRIDYALLKFNNYILTSSVICRKEALENVRFPLMRRRQDWAFFLDLLRVTGFAEALQEVSVKYRKSENSLSSNRLKLIMPNLFFFSTYFYRGNKFLALVHFIGFLPVYFHNKIFNKRK